MDSSPAPRSGSTSAPTRPSVRGATSLDVRDVSFRYGGAERPALDRVSFSVSPGERVGLLGPNGAGKSTLMRLVCGFLPPGSDGGSIRVGEVDAYADSRAVRRNVGYMPEHVPLYPELRVQEHLAFRADLKGVRRGGREVTRVAGLTGLGDMLSVPIGRLSRGYRQRVGMADALLGAPPLVILDEPTVGLDPNQVQDIRAVLRDLGTESTLMFSSHILGEVEALCDRIVILAQGSVVVDANVRELLTGAGVVARLDAGPAEVARVIGAMREQVDTPELSIEVTRDDGVAVVRVDVPDDVNAQAIRDALGRGAAEHGATVLQLQLASARLEEVFAQVTGAIDARSPEASA